VSRARGQRRPPDQLPLGVTLRNPRSFENFVSGPNGAAVAAVRALLIPGAVGVVYLWGGAGCGKTHLLEACCGDPTLHGRPVAYLPLKDARVVPEMLGGLADAELLCIDDVDSVAGAPVWEEALFHLYNRAEQAGCPVVFSARTAPRTPAWLLPDLVSRLTAAVVWRLRPLPDDQRREVLQLHARDRGFVLGDEVTGYILRRLPRDMASLSEFLERLDRSSLAAQRRVTVPFVRALLEEGDGGGA
jgi:DnaA family protein